MFVLVWNEYGFATGRAVPGRQVKGYADQLALDHGVRGRTPTSWIMPSMLEQPGPPLSLHDVR